MANTSSLFGFKPIKYLNGAPWNGKVGVYYASASDTAVIYKGDMVAMQGTASKYESTGKYPCVTRAGVSSIMVGVAIGFSTVPYISADPTNLFLSKRTASTAMYVFVVDDPMVIFEAQESEVTAAIAAALVYSDVMANGKISLGAGAAAGTLGNDTTGTSYMGINSIDVHTNAGSAATEAIKVLRLADKENNALGAYAVWEVMINQHYFGSGSIGLTRS
jgi:hypothetical protein